MPENDPATETLTRAQWEAQRATELATKTTLELAQKVAALEGDNRELRGQKLKDGQVAVSKDDAALLEQYRSYGKPDELKTQLEERARLQGDLSARDRRDSIRAAAESAGFKPGMLERLIPQGATLEVRDAQQDGKTVKVPYLKDAQGAETPLLEWAKSDPDFLPALTVSAVSTQTTAPAGPAWVQQPATSSSPAPSDNPLLAYALSKNAALAPKGT